jgi:heterotetrameric sarcosine oxidase gamma subunit
MLKRNSSLDSIYLPGSYPNKNDITLTFKEDKSLFLKQLACWPNTLFETENFIKQELGLNNVPDFNKGFVNEEISIWRIEPFKWWILKKEINLSDELGTNLDLSQAFTCINISGENASLLLNRFLPIDLRDTMFPEFSSASAAIHHVSIKLLKYSNDNYYLFIPRGFALSIWEILLESSKQFGYEILER